MSENSVIPIFPLQRVVFPDSVLRLQIFEQRYLDMIARQLAAPNESDRGFGVVLIKKGQEVGLPAEPFQCGTYVEIVDFDQKENGLLLITCIGKQRFVINSCTRMPDNLLSANISFLDNLTSKSLLDDQFELVNLLSDLSQHPQVDILDDPQKWQELGFVMERLAEFMPINERQKQAFLETSDLNLRAAVLY